MGNAKFFYFPFPDGNALVTIDLGEQLGELFSEYEYDVASSHSRGGRRYLSHGFQREFVTIQRDRLLLGEDLAMKLMSMQNHLDRGGYVSFCADSEKAFLFPVINTPQQSGTSLLLGSNPFNDVTGANLPSVNDYITLQTPSPTSIIEHKKISNVDSSFSSSVGGTITTDSFVFSYNDRAFVRYYRFWPTLRRPTRSIGQNIITNENGRLFSLNVQLYLDTYKLFMFHPGDDGIDLSPNFKPSDVPVASGGSAGGNPFGDFSHRISGTEESQTGKNLAILNAIIRDQGGSML